jgi:hypothetical protein
MIHLTYPHSTAVRINRNGLVQIFTPTQMQHRVDTLHHLFPLLFAFHGQAPPEFIKRFLAKIRSLDIPTGIPISLERSITSFWNVGSCHNCLALFPLAQMRICTQSHRICLQCLKHHQNQEQLKQFTTKCLYLECQASLLNHSLLSIGCV